MSEVRVLKIDTGEAQKSVKDLRKELKDLRDTLLNTEQGTEEYNRALQQAADIQHTLKEQMEEVNATAMDFGQIAGNVVKATGGLVAGFQAAKATMNLLGVENETVIKSLEKMQNLMAITQAIPALDEGVKAFKRLGLAIKSATAGMNGFKAALVSTGIGAAVVALGLLVANWDKVTEAMKRWGIIHQSTAEKLEEEKKKAEELKQKLEEAQQAYKDWQKQSAINNLSSAAKEEYNELNNQIEGYKLRLNEIVAEQANAGRARWEELKEEAVLIHEQMRLAKVRQDEILADKNLTEEATEAAKAAQEAAKKAAEERRKELEKEKKEIEELKNKYSELSFDISLYDATELQKNIAELDKAEQKAIKTIEDAERKGVITVEQAEKDKLAVQKHYAKERAKAEKDAAKEEQETRIKDSIDILDTSHQLELAKLQSQYDEKLISEEEFNNRKKELQTAYVQDYVDNIKYLLETEDSLTNEQILDLVEKMNTARASLITEDGSPEANMAKGITEAINASALALGEFSDNPAWGNILKNIATLTANWEVLHKQIQKGGKEAFTAYAQIAAVGLNSIGTMLTELGNEQDTSNKKGFEAQKKYQYGATVVNMLAGIASAWASSMQLPFPVNVIIGTLMSAMMATTGAMQLSKISKTKFGDKSGASGASSASPNSSAVSSVIAPVQYTQDVQGASIEGAIQDSRVFVVESDITNTQDRVAVTESEARY